MTMPDSRPVEEIKARLDLAEVIGAHVRLQRAGRELRGLCPFHDEKTPSFYVSPEKQLWHCQGCHQGGDLFRFVELLDRVDFKEALERLARRAGVELPEGPGARAGPARREREQVQALHKLATDFYHHVLGQAPAGAPGRAMLEARGVGAASWDHFQLGYAPAGARQDNLVRFLVARGQPAAAAVQAGLARRGPDGAVVDFFRRRLMIPIRDERGTCIAFGGRALGDEPPKYLNTRATATFDKSRVLFGLDRARETLRRQRTAVIVEGYFDVIAAHAAGVTEAVSTSGTALTPAQARLLRRFAETAILCFDGDAAGRRAAAAAVDVIAAELEPRLLLLPEGRDPDELCREDPDRFRALVTGARPAWEVLVDEALGDAPPGADPRTLAARRAVIQVLARIPEASVRDLYAARAARRLGVDPRHLLTDMERSRRGRPAGPPVPGPPPAGAPGTAGPEAGSLTRAESGNAPPDRVGYLLGLLVHAPERVADVRERYGLAVEEFPDTAQRAIYGAMVRRQDGVLEEAELDRDATALLARLRREAYPELTGDPAASRVDRVLEDCVRAIRIDRLTDRALELERRLRLSGHHRHGEVPAVVGEWEAIRHQIELLKRGEPPVAGGLPITTAPTG